MNPLVTRSASMLLGLAALGTLLRFGIAEEIPLAQIKGSLVMEENGRPLKDALIELIPAVSQEEESPLRSRFVETDETGKFQLRNVTAGDYTVAVSTNAHSVKRFFLKLGEGQKKQLDMKAEPVDSYLDIYGSAHVFTPNETGEFELKGFFRKPVKELKLTAYKLDFQKVVSEGSLYNALAPLSRNGSANVKNPASMGTIAKTWTMPIDNVDEEGVFMQKLRAEKFAEGLYWIDVEAKEEKVVRSTWLNVTKIAMIGKQVNGQTIAYVTDISTGEPVPGAEVGFGSGGTYKVIGQTGSDGTLRTDLPKSDRRVLVAGSGDSRALVDFYRNEQSHDGIKMVSYTDRTIYRPGDTVQFKGIVRKLTGSSYTIPESAPVNLQLLDQSDNVVAESKTTSSAMGTYNGEFTINRESEPGYFSVIAKYGESEDRLGFSVAAYRKPTYTVTVTPEKPSYVRGERGRFKVKVEYYFGGPVPGAKVEAYVYREIDWWSQEMEEEYGEMTSGVSGDYSESIEAKTDANGEAWIEFDTATDKTDAAEYNFRYSASVSVADEGGKYYDGQGSVRVTRGEIDLAVETPVYISKPGAPIEFKLSATATSGKLEGRPVEIESGFELWDGKSMVTLRPEKKTVTLGADGKASVSFTPARGGSYTVHAKLKDDRGNSIGASAYVWIDGVIEGNPGPFPALTVKLDKKEYKAGDVAQAMIQTDRPGGTALVTLESDRIHMVRTVKLDKNVATIDIPVLDDYTPNVDVVVAYVKDKKYNEASRDLHIQLGHRELQIDVKPDKENYKPGETATFAITTKTDQGVPVPAEISLGVVDESIYALSEDNFDLAEALYPERSNDIETQYSFPELYLDGGDKAPTSIQVRRKFKDTAFWAPTVQTDASGQGTVTVPLPDNLTTWRATVRGVTNRTEAGQAVSKVMANKELMVRLEGPSFMVNGDQQVVKAVITSRTGQASKVKVQFEPTNLTVDGQLQQEVDVPANGNASVQVTVTPPKSGEAALVAKAWIDGGANDGVEQKFEVRPHGVLIDDRFSGDTKATNQFKVTVREGADIETGRLKVNVAPTIAWTMTQSLDYLIDFPYGCVEQTMSRFFPAVAVSGAVNSLGAGKPSRAAEIPQIAADGITRLQAMQNSSGGWGWWNYDNADPSMTAYVLEGLLRAKQAGFRVPENMSNRALEWADKYLESKVTPPEWAVTPAEISSFWTRDTANRTYLASIVARWGHTGPAGKFLAGVKIEKATAVTAANLALAAKALGKDPKPAIAKLSSLARVSGAIATWDEEFWGVETTARSLYALVSVDPQNPLIGKAIRYLMEKRRGQYWYSTRDTAYTLIALAQYLGTTKELTDLTGEVTLRVNGQDMGRVVFSQGGLNGPPTEFVIPLAQLKKGENTLELVRSNGGIVYYGVDLRQTVPVETANASAPGLTITRTYRKLESRRLEDGTIQFGPGKNPIVSADAGDLIQVELKIKTDKRRDFVLIEDPIPASCRITDREDLPTGETWTWWWSKSAFYDDRAAFFTSSLPAGESIVTYTMRAEMLGKSTARPTVVYNMYDPDQRSVAPEITLEVR